MGPFGTGGMPKSVCFGRPSSELQEDPSTKANAIPIKRQQDLSLGTNAVEKRGNDMEVN
jgi:hypothetical protein